MWKYQLWLSPPKVYFVTKYILYNTLEIKEKWIENLKVAYFQEPLFAYTKKVLSREGEKGKRQTIKIELNFFPVQE